MHTQREMWMEEKLTWSKDTEKKKEGNGIETQQEKKEKEWKANKNNSDDWQQNLATYTLFAL